MGRTIFAAGLAIDFAFMAPANSHAQSRPPTAQEIKAIRDCARKYQDNIDDEQNCLFKLVADPCIGPNGGLGDGPTAECYYVEAAVWDKLLNENYKALLGQLDDDQTAKARGMQRAWIAYRDTVCQFYDDKIQGSMSGPMHAACMARQTARQAMLLSYFSQL
jgi:uncharacterized protein YecT (DUF1311 family)